ncbi:MAG: DinB family protein [Chitinophagaceae bacterium]|nr:DinB family protein [Chitinophagaceae bacterium]
MKMKSIELVEQLQADVRQLILTTGYLQSERQADVVTQPATGKWSVVQVLEHLNSYGRYYLPALETSVRKGRHPSREWYHAGWLGDYFTRIMRPAEDGQVKNKMKAPKEHRPTPNLDAKAVMETFLEQQRLLLELLEQAKSKDIGHIRTPISLSRFIRLKTGDTFRFLVAHEQRHFTQIQRTLVVVKESKGKFPIAHQVA